LMRPSTLDVSTTTSMQVCHPSIDPLLLLCLYLPHSRYRSNPRELFYMTASSVHDPKVYIAVDGVPSGSSVGNCMCPMPDRDTLRYVYAQLEVRTAHRVIKNGFLLQRASVT